MQYRTLAGSTLAAALIIAATALLPDAANAAQTPAKPQAAPAAGQPGITVTGIGRATVAPDRAEIRIKVAGGGPALDRAYAVQRDKAQLLTKAIATFADVGATLEGEGMKLGRAQSGMEAMMMIDFGNEAPEASFEAVETMRVSLSLAGKGLDDVVALVNAAIETECSLASDDVGLPAYVAMQLGQSMETAPPPITYHATEQTLEAARAEALQAAYANARTRAEELAKTAGVTLGAPTSIRITTEFPLTSEVPAPTQRTLQLEATFAIE